ncbi:MAG: arginine--tRNA ligase [Crocinitomicaceae bacterium]|nr:arginine--tRNA ligase [Crocinitomicaceae bacterium]
MYFLNQISETISNAVYSLFGDEAIAKPLVIEQTKKVFVGDFTLVVFPLLKFSKKKPEETADLIGDYLVNNSSNFSSFNVVKGFLNIQLSHSYWGELINNWCIDESFGIAKKESGRLYMVEYSSPNTNKPLHLGHLRNIFLGDSVANILKANGHKVVKTQIINDRGIHICKSMVAWLKFANDESPESNQLKGDHLVGKYYVEFDKAYKEEIQVLVNEGLDVEKAKLEAPIFKSAQDMLLKWEKGDVEVRALWSKMNNWVYSGFEKTYNKMGVEFDKLYYESDTYSLGKLVVESGLDSGTFYQKEDKSIWCDLSKDKMDDKLLLRSDGTSVYMTQDIGTAVQRYEDYPGLSGIVYTVGNEQNHHFKVLFKLLSKLDYSWSDECYHLSYGMVELPEGKMKSREGTVVDADDLMDAVINEAKLLTNERGHLEGLSEDEIESLCTKIGLSGLKYYLLKVDPKRKMMFDPKESIDLNGHTGPFIQYGYARIKSLLNKKKSTKDFIVKDVEFKSQELELIKSISIFPEIIRQSSQELSPAILANYLFSLVKAYNSFYQSCPILKEEDENIVEFRLKVSDLTSRIIKKGMFILGIKVPERM